MKLKILSILAEFILFFLSLFVFFPLTARASLEFETKFNISYQIGVRGSAKVTQEISLINKFSNIYPQEYRFQINGLGIKNISATDSQGDIIEEVKETTDSTEIKLKFNQEAVGKGKELKFKISYSFPNFAKKRGQVWEIIVPGLANIKEIDEINLKIKVPSSFGSLAYSSISPLKQKKENNYQTVSYQRSQLIKKPLVLAFGEFQIFNFSLKFYLSNPRSEMVIQEIPIPPETAYQSVILSSVEPLPERINLDRDYNWIAQYLLYPEEEKEITVKGQAKIFSQPANIDFREATKMEDFSPYLKEDRYWQINNPTIKSLAQKYNSPKKIFNFVVDDLEYDFDNIATSQRVGALKAHQNKRGVCTEFSDLFVALSRANGIPSRELEGFAFTDDQKIVSLSANNDILHSWAEYWDSHKEVWVPVDPTWSKTTHGMDFLTKFDLGHFIFVIHGQNSLQPFPPGFYRTNNNQRNIQVEFADKLINPPTVEFGVELKIDKEKLKLVVKNKSLTPVYKSKVKLLGWKKKDSSEKEISFLPPLGEKEIVIDQPNFFLRLFGQPIFYLDINGSPFELEYPRPKLNFRTFFAKLLKK